MQTQELHIELDILLQKVNSHYTQNFLPQEKDLFINNEIVRFVNRRLDRLGNRKGTGIFDTIKRTTELSPLLTTRKLPVMYDTNNQKEARVLLPFDFLYYASSEVSVCCPCMGNKLYSKKYYKSVLELKNLNIANFSIYISQGLYNYTVKNTDIPTDYFIEDSIPAYSNKIMLINALMLLLKNNNITDVDISFDKVKNVINFQSYKPFTFKVNNNEMATEAITFKTYEEITDPLISTVEVMDEEFKAGIKKSYLSGAKDEKSLVVIRDKELIYTIKGVIGDYVFLTYLRKPSKINLLLQSNSELKDETLSEIISDTAQRMMAVIGSDNYANFVQENTLIE